MGIGLLVESHMGRPTKVEGNPEHPSSGGATDVFTQASILGLYDPDRSQVVSSAGEIRTWSAFVATIGRPGIATEPPGEITVALRCCPGLNPWTPFADNKGVWIQTFDSAGKAADRSFHLIVLTQ